MTYFPEVEIALCALNTMYSEYNVSYVYIGKNIQNMLICIMQILSKLRIKRI